MKTNLLLKLMKIHNIKLNPLFIGIEAKTDWSLWIKRLRQRDNNA